MGKPCDVRSISASLHGSFWVHVGHHSLNFKGFRLMLPTLKIKVSRALEAWLEAPRNDFLALGRESCGAVWISCRGWMDYACQSGCPCANKGLN